MSQDMIIITPENAEIRVPLAGVFSRAAAFVYDVFLQILIMIALNFGLTYLLYYFRFPIWYSSLYAVFYGFFLIISLVWTIGYYVYFEVRRNGRTPGKKAFGIRVVMANGQQVRFFNSLLRNILRVADFLPSFFMAGVFTALITENQQRIGDFLANTIVIRDENV